MEKWSQCPEGHDYIQHSAACFDLTSGHPKTQDIHFIRLEEKKQQQMFPFRKLKNIFELFLSLTLCISKYLFTSNCGVITLQ